MNKSRLLLFCACLFLVVVGFVAKQSLAATEARKDVLYTCNCGDQCKCNSVSTAPGKCKCGSPLKWGHILKTEGDDALICQCEEGCTCSLDPKDSTKCGCGKSVKRVSLAGSGLYFCNCGGSCTCNTVSPQPGKCKCNMELKKAN